MLGLQTGCGQVTLGLNRHPDVPRSRWEPSGCVGSILLAPKVVFLRVGFDQRLGLLILEPEVLQINLQKASNIHERRQLREVVILKRLDVFNGNLGPLLNLALLHLFDFSQLSQSRPVKSLWTRQNRLPQRLDVAIESARSKFLDLRKNQGKEELRARDLFLAMWIPDLFMKRVENGDTWSLFCPNEAPGLADVWGEEFERLRIRIKFGARVIRSRQQRKCFLIRGGNHKDKFDESLRLLSAG